MAATSSIGSKAGPEVLSSGLRARPLPRTEREVDGADLDAAITASGLPYAKIAEQLGVNESLVRHIRGGNSALTWSKIRRLPKSVKRALLTAELARDEDETPRSVAPLHEQAIRATESSTRLAMTIVEAERDSVLDAEEIEKIEADALRGERMHLLVRLSAGAMRKTVTR